MSTLRNIRLTRLLLNCRFLVATTLGVFPALMLAHGSDDGAAIRTFVDRCQKLVNEQFREVRIQNSPIHQWPSNAEQRFCPTNHRAFSHTQSHNRTMREPQARLRWEAGGNQGIAAPESMGACEGAVWSLQEAFVKVRDQFSERCKSQSRELGEFRAQCLGERANIQIECPGRAAELHRRNSESATRIADQANQIRSSLVRFAEANRKLMEKYEADLRALRTLPPAAETTTIALSERNVVAGPRPNPFSGGVSTEQEYLQLLAGGNNASLARLQTPIESAAQIPPSPQTSEGPLLLEVRQAQQAQGKFREAVEQFAQEHRKLSEGLASSLERFRNPTNQNDRPGQHIQNLAPLATGGLGILNQRTSPPPTPLTSPASVVPGSLPLSGALPLLAAGASGMAQSRGSSGSSASNLPSVIQGPLEHSAPSLKGTEFGRAEEELTPQQPLGTTINGTDVGNNKSENDVNRTGPAAPLSEGAGLGLTAAKGGPGDNDSGAESRFTQRKPAGKETNGPQGDTSLDLAAGGQGLSFQEDLTPKKTDRSNTDGVGEVTNLLGQMKNLFNLDDPFGASGGSTAGFSNPFAAGETNQITALGEQNENGLDWAAGNDSTHSPFVTATDEANPWTKSDQSQSEVRRPAETDSIFKRVRLTHQRAMARGLVVLSFGEIPQ
jgi:hypothetical protein